MSSHAQDDGFHEIQLNGKQLVFLFMAATVVSVVIFLCGVLVGRGVRAERGTTDVASVQTVEPTPQPPESAPTPTATGSDPTAAPPPAPVDDLSYFNRLEKPNTPAEHLKPPSDTAAKAPAPAPPQPAPPAPARAAAEPPRAPTPRAAAAQPQTPPAAASREPAKPPVAEPASSESAGQGYAVQIAALNVRSEADAIARRLTSKGYSAYVVAPASGTPSVYRVRVGKFPTRREAESIAARLQKEEQFKPWITR